MVEHSRDDGPVAGRGFEALVVLLERRLADCRRAFRLFVATALVDGRKGRDGLLAGVSDGSGRTSLRGTWMPSATCSTAMALPAASNQPFRSPSCPSRHASVVVQPHALD